VNEAFEVPLSFDPGVAFRRLVVLADLPHNRFLVPCERPALRTAEGEGSVVRNPFEVLSAFESDSSMAVSEMV
jgi:hypothetical protein